MEKTTQDTASQDHVKLLTCLKSMQYIHITYIIVQVREI